jgi:hypothetical protein
MPDGDIETYFDEGAWRNRVEGSGTTAFSFTTKAEAAEVAREEAMKTKVDHIIRKEGGEIEERHSYGHDPGDVAG